MSRGRFLIESLEARWLLDALVNNNAGATGTSNFTQSEASVVAFGNTVVVAFNDSGSNAGGSNKFTGIARSTDGGATFTDLGMLPTSGSGDAGAPVLARDVTTGRIYLSTLPFFGNPALVFRSDDNGATWSVPVGGTPGISGPAGRPWIAVDNFPGTGQGNVYVMARDFGPGNGVFIWRSMDGGVTFGPSGGTLLATGGHLSYVTVGPDHSVYAFWYAGTTLQMRKSTDLGVTFGSAITVASGLMGGFLGDLGLTGIRQGTTTAAAFRTTEYPVAAVNPVNGNLYVVYNNDPPGTDKADIFLVQSTTGGASWSAPVRVNDDSTTTDQWQPTLAVLPGGTHLGVFYYSRQVDAAGNNLFRYYARVATISGATLTFSPSVAVSDVTSLPEFGRDAVVNSVYMGDYDAAFATSDSFHVVWADNRDDLPGGAGRKDPQVYYERLTVGITPAITNASFTFETDQSVNFTFNTDVGASLATTDFLVLKLPAGPTVSTLLSYDAAANRASLFFNGILADGNYVAVAQAPGITDLFGTPLSSDFVFSFFFLNGDANRDRRVDIGDFSIVASRFNLPGTFSQGDFNYNGITNIADFSILASKFNTSLPAPGEIPRPFATASAGPIHATGADSIRQAWVALEPDNAIELASGWLLPASSNEGD